MVWSSSHRRNRFNSDWARTRKLVLERDGHRCQQWVTDEDGFQRRCGRYANQVDHIRRDPVRDDDSLSNLQSLCQYHHEQKTCVESMMQRRENKEKRRRDQWYSHPAFQ